MKTLRQQINAVDNSITILENNFQRMKTKLQPPQKIKWAKRLQGLKNAKTTLLSIQLIGEKKIQLLPELIEAAKNCANQKFLASADCAIVLRKMGIKI